MDSLAYSRIVRDYLDVVYRAALSCCHNPADAEDAVQNTFLKLLTADPAFADAEHMRRWLIRVAVNECRNQMRSFWSRKVVSFDTLEREPMKLADDERWLFDEVSRLPVKYSSVLHLYYYEGYTCGEIAQLLHISETNVQTRLHRARKMLKTRLEEA